MHDAHDVLLPCLQPERRGTDDPQPLRVESDQHQAYNERAEFELTSCAVARVDS